MPNLTLRYDVRESDRDEVQRIIASSGFFNPGEIAVAVELVDERVRHGEACSYRFVFAESGSSVVGYTCYGHIPGTEHSYDLYWIAVDAALRGQGVGRGLLEETERLIAAAGGRRVYIETSNRKQYVSTRSFYDAAGYRLEALLKDFYAPGDDKAMYVKVIQPS